LRKKVARKELDDVDKLITALTDAITAILLPVQKPLDVSSQKPFVLLVVGVNGSGKTTTIGKLSRRFTESGKQVVLAAGDTFRAAAIEQLGIWASRTGAEIIQQQAGADPGAVVFDAVTAGRSRRADLVIIDTAGRLHVDPEMMRQARRIKDVTKPQHVLMAADAMTGQDAVVQAREFMREVDTTGFVLTKLDGDARGGAALSITAVTGRPVYFVGTGEKPDDLEAFYPDRMAGRILGMGDVLTLIDKAQEKLDTAEAQKAAENMLKGQFTFEDFLDQLRQVQKLGSMGDLLKMLPGVPGGKNAMKEMAGAIDEGELKRAEAMILSMTPAERREPGIISGSRRLRIANGSGATTADVNSLLKDFEGARRMMRTMMGGKKVPGMRMPTKLPKR
jgi:signal recognition particle subunit SRP54